VAGLFRRRRFVKTRPAALAAIAVQSELRYNQERASGLQDAAVHAPRFVRKDAEVNRLLRQILGVLAAVRMGYTQENE
jgi:hypothetical protein